MTGGNSVTIVTAIIAAAASLMAVILGIEHLTSGARLRNLEATLRGALSSAPDDGRKAVLVSLHTETVGRLLARDAVPGWRFAGPALFPLASMAVVANYWLLVAKRPDQSLAAVVLGSLGAAAIGVQGLVMCLNLARERARVARCYRKGVTPIRAYTDILARMESGRRDEFLWAYATCVALAGGVAGASMLAAKVAVPAEIPLLLVVAAVVAVPIFFAWFRKRVTEDRTIEPRNRDGSLKPAWTHPVDQGGGATEGTD
ncbi:hypothetical protein [Cellulomonas sp. SG140]|uniref:hypothetical protein n=1 Tax=Cellulomonas sp. SG140 TaxID=2976536 RepID=UPI0021E95F1F|nr:hypothetical protein [Cellulomonas sp. SG140]